MKIVVLDGFAANPGDLSWENIEKLGELTVYHRTATEDITARIGDAEVVLTNKTPIGAAVMDGCKSLKYIGVLATGYNIIDIEAAKARGITVCNIPAYSTPSVAQFVFALMLEYCHHVGDLSRSVHRGRWAESPDFCYWDSPLVELDGKTLTVVGFGSIGTRVAQMAAAFGMRVLAVAHRPEKVVQNYGAELVSLDEGLKRADFVTLHTPLTDETRQLIDKAAIEKMKPGAVLINTARGALINEGDVADALKGGRLACYAADSLSCEPPKKDNPLIVAPNCILTPHVAWAPVEARRRLMDICGENIKAWLDGTTRNVVG